MMSTTRTTIIIIDLALTTLSIQKANLETWQPLLKQGIWDTEEGAISDTLGLHSNMGFSLFLTIWVFTFSYCLGTLRDQIIQKDLIGY